jgi:predicted nucleic acid-binding protein
LIGVVVDASITLAWCFPDESSDYADRVLLSLERKPILVPAVWCLEVANAILVGERRKRVLPADIKHFLTLLDELSLVEDVQSVTEHMSNVLPLARKHDLSAYDAAYLELAIRHGAPLATADAKLQNAAKRAGVKIFTGEAKR